MLVKLHCVSIHVKVHDPLIYEEIIVTIIYLMNHN